MSCVVHAFAALEGVANKLRFERFKNKESIKYQPTTTAAEKQFLEDWDNRRVALEHKLAFLGKHRQHTLSSDVIADVEELRDLRNLVAHGYVTKGRALFQVTSDEFRSVHSLVADKTQHKKKFPRLKFGAPDRLKYRDAGVALRVAVKAAHDTLELYHDSEFIPVYETDPQTSYSLGFGHSPDDLLKLID